MAASKSQANKEAYNLWWPTMMHPAAIELTMIRKGGSYRKKNGSIAGNGLFFHYKRFQEIVWPQKSWHRWNLLLLQNFIEKRIIAVIGAASSGKTHEAGIYGLVTYYAFSDQTTVMVSSTERDRLEERVWGEIKKYHKMARAMCPWLPGQLLESRQRLLTDERYDSEDGRDFRNGCVGIPCFPSGTLVDTPSGPRKIETLQIGEVVLNAGGTGRITKTHQSISDHLFRITLSDGRTLDCTGDHPIFTQRGWTNARDLKTLDMVFSAHQTLCIMRGTIGGGLPKSKVLFRSMSQFSPGEKVRAMQESIPSVEQKDHLDRQDSRQVLQPRLLRTLGVDAQRVLKKHNHTLQALRSIAQKHSSRQGVLLGEMPQSTRYKAMPSMWEGICFNSGISREATVAFLQQVLQEESDWKEMFPAASITNPGRTCSLEEVSRFNFSLPHKDWIKTNKWKRPLVPDRHCFSGNKVSCRNRRRNTPHPGKANKGQVANQDSEFAWVDRVEILEQSSDKRFEKSRGGYSVHNLEVDGHPSYSVSGVIVHNCKRGGNYVGLGSFSGLKNKKVILIADEGQFMPRAYVDAISNLNKNAGFQCIVMGNPKDTTDALGIVAEPSAEFGGWDGGIDQTGATKTWPTRFPGGICIQLVGSDCPNMDAPEDQEPPYPYLITRKAIENDIQFYGKDSLQFSMMNDGRMPRGQGLRRVITRQMCLKFGAMEAPVWVGEKRTKIGFMDAAYGSVGGDRCVFGELQFGPGLLPDGKEHIIMALIGTMLVPVSVKENELPEYQIAKFVKEQCENRGIVPDNFFFDSTGRGSLMGAFARIWSANVQPVEFGGRATERIVSNEIRTLCKDYYSKFVSELWFSVRMTVESKQFRGMTEEMMQEGTMREWKLVAGNKVEVETKEEMKEKVGRSPDLFDSLVSGVEGARRRGFVISKLAGVSAIDDRGWKDDLRKKAEALRSRHALTYSS